MSDLLWTLFSTSADILTPGLGLLATCATLFAVPVSWLRRRRASAILFGTAALAFTPGLLLMGPLAPDVASILAPLLYGPPPSCPPDMCGTGCMGMYEFWLQPARDLVWTTVTASDAVATACMALGLRFVR